MARIFITNAVFPEKFPAATPDAGGDVVENNFTIDLTDPIFAGALPLQVGDIIEFGQIAADTLAVDYIWDNDAWDTNATPTLAANFGILSGTPGTNDATRTIVTQWEAAKSFGAANFSRMPNNNALRTAKQTYDQGLALVITAAAATAATTGKVNLHLQTKG